MNLKTVTKSTWNAAAHIVIPPALAIGAFYASAWTHGWQYKQVDIAAIVTTFYAGLVYFQLDEMRKQRKQQDEERAQAYKRTRTTLCLETPLVMSGFSDFYPTQVLCTLRNKGDVLARHCQPILESIWILEAGQWRDLLLSPQPLAWADQYDPSCQDRFKDRYLISLRDYSFHLVSQRMEDDPRLEVMIGGPTPPLFGPGTYFLQVIVYAENAEPEPLCFRAEFSNDGHPRNRLKVTPSPPPKTPSRAPWPNPATRPD